MQFHITENGALRVMVSDAELARMGLSFADLDHASATTRTALGAVLLTAEAQTGFTACDRMLIEAIPLEDGCLLLFTPDQQRPRLRLRRAAPTGVWRFADADALLAFAVALRPFVNALERRRALCVGSLYRQEDTYLLIVYAPSMMPRGMWPILSEFAEHIGDGTTAALTEEHDTPVCLHDALLKLAMSV